MKAGQSGEDQLNDWIATIDREARRHIIIDRTLRADATGRLSLPIRFGFKVVEIGPVEAVKLSYRVVIGRLRQR